MWYLFDCHNQVVGRYKTLRGLKCAQTRQTYRLLERYWHAVENNIPCENHYMMTRFINSVNTN